MFLFLKEKYLYEKVPTTPASECLAVQVSERTLDDRVRMLSSSSILRRYLGRVCLWASISFGRGHPGGQLSTAAYKSCPLHHQPRNCLHIIGIGISFHMSMPPQSASSHHILKKKNLLGYTYISNCL